LIVFGRVPLFYSVVHLFLIHGLTFPAAWIRYGHAGFLLTPIAVVRSNKWKVDVTSDALKLAFAERKGPGLLVKAPATGGRESGRYSGRA